MSEAPAIELDGVTAGYRNRPVLADVSIRLAAGGMAALLGPNGGGKSTLLRVITGLVPASAGRVRLFGRDVRGIGAAERARLAAVVPQEMDAPLAFTVEEMVLMGRTAALGRWQGPARADRLAVERSLVYTDTLDLRQRPYPELSGGEKQRVAIAMALAAEPRLILLDEPTSHLDMNHRVEIVRLIGRLNAERQVAVLMAGHDLNLAAEHFPRILLLDHGRVAADGAPADVLEPRLLQDVYHCEVSIQRDPLAGCLRVFPARSWDAGERVADRRVHVICGGGSGEELLRRLHLAGCRVSCGVLNEGDTDAAAARALGLGAATEKPFSPIGEAALAGARELMRDAEAVIVSDVPFGSGNLANLDLAEEARRAGRPVLVNTREISRRDYTPGREAARRLDALIAAGAIPWQHAHDVPRLIAEHVPPGREEDV